MSYRDMSYRDRMHWLDETIDERIGGRFEIDVFDSMLERLGEEEPETSEGSKETDSPAAEAQRKRESQIEAPGDGGGCGVNGEGQILRGELKWFSPLRGYGFVVLEECGEDALLSFSCLKQAGRHNIARGTRIACRVARRPKGIQIIRIHSIDEEDYASGEQDYASGEQDYASGEALPARRDYAPGEALPARENGAPGGDYASGGNGFAPGEGFAPEAEEAFEEAVMKWFDSRRGYGFATILADQRDVFLHSEILQWRNLEHLRGGERVWVRSLQGPKGLAATDIRVQAPDSDAGD